MSKMEKSNQSPKMVKTQARFPNRAARLYWQANMDGTQPLLMSSPRALQHQYQFNSSAELGNPLVIAAIVSGVLGVLLIAVIIIGVWIRSRLMSFRDQNSSASQSSRMSSTRSLGHTANQDSTIMSSISTLDDECQFDSIRLDDTSITIYNCVDHRLQSDKNHPQNICMNNSTSRSSDCINNPVPSTNSYTESETPSSSSEKIRINIPTELSLDSK